MGSDEFTAYSDHELAVIDHVGSLVEFWNFKKQMGRVWAVLFLSKAPLPADEVTARLSISTGLANMTLNALIGWGVVRKVWVQGDRRNFYEAETRPWRMISHVLERREFQEIDRIVELLEEVCERKDGEEHPDEFRRKRLESLLELARQGRQILSDVLHLSLIRIGPLQELSVKLAAGYLRRQVRKVAGGDAGTGGPADDVSESEAYGEDELAIIDQVGQLIELWGFAKNMGRVWAALYLAFRPLPSDVLQKRLSVSSGLANTTLNALDRWGVVHKIRVPGERKTFYAAETDPWRMISNVLRSREHRRIREAIEVCEEALAGYPRKVPRDVAFRKKRVESLLDFFRLGERLLEGVLGISEVDLQQLQDFSLKE